MRTTSSEQFRQFTLLLKFKSKLKKNQGLCYKTFLLFHFLIKLGKLVCLSLVDTSVISYKGRSILEWSTLGWIESFVAKASGH
jgi:hypothetical protein